MDMNGIVGLGGCGIIHNGEVSLYSIFYFSIFFFFFEDDVFHMG